MLNWPGIPDDAIEFFYKVFAEANRIVSERLINVPNIRETSLDDGLIEAIIPSCAPRLLPSGAVVQMDVHNIGGLRRLYSWETADIAILVFVYRAEALIAQKIGLLQSKRLYPENNDVQDEDPVGFQYGMNEFLRRDPHSPLHKLHVQYDFVDGCKYAALKAGSKQVAAMKDMNNVFGEVVYYLLYNPPTVPSSTRYPVKEYVRFEEAPVGCRVRTAGAVETSLEALKEGESPTYAQLEGAQASGNWRLESWVVDLLKCNVGQQFDESREEKVAQMLERRSGPIGAAIAISIALPEDS
ncbi:hypothetical protein [Rhizobium sp. NZLR1]|uniref:hypothetical protein n=1 Tax=Rhizobium sp. NZLR1 TaxID=2731096 RepID=UPI001A99723D|nr:hypothetical protein [Rhizobium sp. NZLR1]MBX5204102.1 hypothetical protein [Rhizobium sp. NZLR1]QSZ25106.1 hypothetical protein J3O30_32600 [Rhizobium sp. NZLR1]